MEKVNEMLACTDSCSRRGSQLARRAFSLIELLCVIAVIGILATILITGIGRMRSGAFTAKCVSNLRSINDAARLYAADNDNRIPPAFYPADSSTHDPLDLNNVVGHLAPYTGWERASSMDTKFQSMAAVPKIFECPEHPGRMGYAINLTYLSWPGGSWARGWRTYDEATSPGDTVFMADSERSNNPSDWSPYMRWDGANGWPGPAYRHDRKTVNVLWLDGHVTREDAGGKIAKENYWKLIKD